MTVPPRSVFAAAARAALEAHEEWDAPHCFQALHLDGDSLVCRMYACIMTDVEPDDYPRWMAMLADEQHEKDPRDPAYAYLLQTESFRTRAPGPEASAAEREQYDRDRAGRTFHERADAVEVCSAWVADIHGRLWFAEKAPLPGGRPGGVLPAGEQRAGRPGDPRAPAHRSGGRAPVPRDAGRWLTCSCC